MAKKKTKTVDPPAAPERKIVPLDSIPELACDLELLRMGVPESKLQAALDRMNQDRGWRWVTVLEKGKGGDDEGR